MTLLRTSTVRSLTTAILPLRSKPARPLYNFINDKQSYSTVHHSNTIRAPRRPLQHNKSPNRRTLTTTKPRQQNQATPKPGTTPPPNETSTIPPSKIYTYEDIQTLSAQPTPQRILIDVREPSEIQGTGRIPTAKNIPISSAPDAFFLNAEEFQDRFGFEKPGPGVEAVFYCKAGVRSKAAARLASQAGFADAVGEFPGSWVEWFEKGGRVERV